MKLIQKHAKGEVSFWNDLDQRWYDSPFEGTDFPSQGDAEGYIRGYQLQRITGSDGVISVASIEDE